MKRSRNWTRIPNRIGNENANEKPIQRRVKLLLQSLWNFACRIVEKVVNQAGNRQSSYLYTYVNSQPVGLKRLGQKVRNCSLCSCNVALCMMYFLYLTFKCSREVERKCVSEKLQHWTWLASLVREGGTLCNWVEVTRGAAKWITSELFAAGHIRRWTINLRGFHFISFCIHRATTCKWHRKCSKCTCQLSALTVHISIIQLLKSNSRTDPHRISIERERERSARNERYSKSQ